MPLVKINALTDSIELEPAHSGEVGFDVINDTAGNLVVGIEAIGSALAAGFRVETDVKQLRLPQDKGLQRVTVRITAPDRAEGASGELQIRVYDENDRERVQNSSAVSVKVAASAAPVPEPTPQPSPPPKWIWIAVTAAVAVLVIGAVLVFLPDKRVPDLRGRTYDEAQEILQKRKMSLDEDVTLVGTLDDQEIGKVMSQVPAPGEPRTADGKVKVTMGHAAQRIPRLETLTVNAAQNLAHPAGFVLDVRFVETGLSAGGTIRHQDPPEGTPGLPGQVIKVEVERVMVRIPPVRGSPLDAAIAALQELELTVDVQTVQSNAPARTVVDVIPAVGERVAQGSAVVLKVEGEKVPVPQVPGQMSSAVALLTSKGFKIAGTSHYFSREQPAGTVRRTIPPAGTQVALGSDIVLEVYAPPIIWLPIPSKLDVLKKRVSPSDFVVQ